MTGRGAGSPERLVTQLEMEAAAQDRFNMSVRKFLKHVGVTSQREIERVVREGRVDGSSLALEPGTALPR